MKRRLLLPSLLVAVFGLWVTEGQAVDDHGCNATWTECVVECPAHIGDYCSGVAPGCGLKNATCDSPWFGCDGLPYEVECEFQEA